ncbi:outer membrane lipid asymmetry maintenance protein MlaD [Acinetobacter pollinis]|uniref:Outer membrane lipid asymmetry maintenance protein MlaD n=1 Tax=Acinetobacter pollinis TaxID=2605270 RepID=A0ABU6DRA4_9GAMM|nr:outer membrane lipid asymmetry maintenance protein MlaD [Acinetobacter pollinis]MBF7690740.1 outer membrane lipid asymmetry maintenance protein MlaD [Acinetobacter pollinis]MBF7692335.1 outer membrane lipid asymmetry maintenance protein MlaD [Acinetobacter pollinis]MBF7698299.1 outer membrane lipid asymmetry maintenance protein MlaD [Acinetobacter pollinis]MBF7700988.1 outer membrane lipid asymmetry maintenance protein MlaD [Acinetobacter pollinis]MEB5475447.1 outer membrane lipid asymmetry
MKSRASELTVGIFVIIFGAALFFLAMKVSGLSGNNLSAGYQMSATFDNVNGLKPRAKVTMSGVTIGRVDSITLDPISRLAKVTFDLDGKLTTFTPAELQTVQKDSLEELKYSDDYQQADDAKRKVMEQQLLDNMKSITNIDSDAYIMVATNGLLGEKYLKIVPGGGISYLKRGASITNTQGTMDLEDLISKFVTGMGSGNKSSTSQSSSTAQSNSSTQPSFTE